MKEQSNEFLYIFRGGANSSRAERSRVCYPRISARPRINRFQCRTIFPRKEACRVQGMGWQP